MHLEQLEGRRLLSAAWPAADLLADANRDGVITAADQLNEDKWTGGRGGRGAVVLPNVDKDNTATPAPDNWTGGVWNGRPAAPNNVIDNAADLLDVGRFRMAKLGTADAAYNYRVTLRVLKPASDPAWFASASAADRARVFFPTRQSGDNVVPQAGDIAVLGPGLGDTIRFVANPAAANEHSVLDLEGDGFFEFGVEGLKAGAVVRLQLTVEYDPIIISSEPTGEPLPDAPLPDEPPPGPPPVTTDTVAVRVAPFVLSDNRQRANRVIVENMNRYGLDNTDARAALKRTFGTRLTESRSGDLWQQDGYEVGYVRAPYGQMPVVLELPRARDHFFDTQHNMRSFVRGTLLASGVGVSTELTALPNDTASAFGGDIESLPVPGRGAGAPGFLVASGMPQQMRSFFEAQGVNPLLDLKLDDWLGVAHVDEVVQLAPGGKKVLIADPDVAWALAMWAVKIDPNVRMHPGMNSNESLPGYTAEGMKASFFLSNTTFRQQNLTHAQSSTRLRGVYDTVKRAMRLTDEISTPVKGSTNAGSAALVRGGAFTQMLGNTARTFEVKFLDADRYQLRYRDAGGVSSRWFDGRKSRDEVFPEAKAFLLKHYWTGTPRAGDRFTFTTNPSATLIRMPVLFATFGLFHEGGSIPGAWRLAPFSTNYINSLADGETVVSGRAFGPKVNWDGRGKSDLLDAYATAAFRGAGYRNVVLADSRLYHDAGGNLHCGTNTIRAVPTGKWWEVG